MRGRPSYRLGVKKLDYCCVRDYNADMNGEEETAGLCEVASEIYIQTNPPPIGVSRGGFFAVAVFVIYALPK